MKENGSNQDSVNRRWAFADAEGGKAGVRGMLLAYDTEERLQELEQGLLASKSDEALPER
jgi:hypothetical protein